MPLTCTESSQKKCKSDPGSEHIPLIPQKHSRCSPVESLLPYTHLKRYTHVHTCMQTHTYTLTHARTHAHEWPSAWCPPHWSNFNTWKIHREKRIFPSERLARLPALKRADYDAQSLHAWIFSPCSVRMAGRAPILPHTELNWVQNGFGERNAASRKTDLPNALRRRSRSWIFMTLDRPRGVIGRAHVRLMT